MNVTRALLTLMLIACSATAFAAPVGSTFTYQGQLEGAAANASVNFQFKLYDLAGSGALLGTQTVNGVTLSNGLFTVQLDFGATAFNGTARWLEIAVQGPGDPGFTTLAPRQAITPAPYAMYALSGPGGGGGLTLPYFNSANSPTQAAFQIDNTATTGLVHGLVGRTYSTTQNAAGVVGEGSATSGLTTGVHGTATFSPLGTGVVGKGSANGGYFESLAPNAQNSYAAVNAYSANSYGVRAQSDASNGVYALGTDAIYGSGSNAGLNAKGTNYGVLADSYAGFGVYATYGLGLFPGTGANAAVYGSSSSANAASAGVRGQGTEAIGVQGLSASGNGVDGQSTNGYGVSGTTNVATKAGVFGTSGAGDGVWGQSGAPFKSGIVGISYNGQGYGGYFQNQGGGPAAFVNGLAQVKTLQILGADLAESFPVRERTVEPGTVLAIEGGADGALRVCDQAYCRQVAGVVSGANGLDAGVVLKGHGFDEPGHAAVALSGRVWVKCDASPSPIHPGDLLTTAARAGHAMRVEDPARATGAILGKAMTSLETGTGLVLVLVSLQ